MVSLMVALRLQKGKPSAWAKWFFMVEESISAHALQTSRLPYGAALRRLSQGDTELDAGNIHSYCPAQCLNILPG